jgi:ABC-type lipoprotein release transport system permease subunit
MNLVRASLRHYRGLHALVVGGVAVAVAVLAGALLVGASVRASLRDLALARLGATEIVVSTTTFFREALSTDLKDARIEQSVPLLALTAAVTHEDNRRTASRVFVFGIDDRFLKFQAQDGKAPSGRETWVSQALATELGAKEGDSLLLRVPKPTDIPLSYLQGRRDDASARIRLMTVRVLPSNQPTLRGIGDFSLVPSQGPTLSMFVPIDRLQRDLDLTGRANAMLVRMAAPADRTDHDVTIVREALGRAVQLDDLGLRVRPGPPEVTVLESRAGLLTDAAIKPATNAATTAGRPPVPVLTYLANTIRGGGREIPFSLVVGVDLQAYGGPTAAAAAPATQKSAPAMSAAPPGPPIRLNEWAASDLGVAIGDRIEIDYFLWSDELGLDTRTAAFTLAGVVPMSGAGGDATLTPDYPGITDAASVSTWDPPFPVDMKRVRKTDEDYWHKWRAAPKAFVPLGVGQRLWQSPFGTLSSLRVRNAPPGWPAVGGFDLTASGIGVRHARAEALAAASGTTDFGEYFVYFSFFLVVAALLLAGLFFALSIEQRARELGLLTATGFRKRDLTRVVLQEAVVLSGIGAAIGAAAAVGYAAAVMYGLRTWWVGAVGTTALRLHVDPLLVLEGAIGALGASIAALALSLRRIHRRSARELLTAGLAPVDQPVTRRAVWRDALAHLAAAAAVGLIAAAKAGAIGQVPAFFGAGGLLLVAGSAAFARWLRRAHPTSSEARGVIAFGAAYARWRPTRSVLSASLIAFACFVIVSVGAFQRDPSGMSLAHDSGTGGFGLIAESVAPLLYNPNTVKGREESGLGESDDLRDMKVARFRLRPGDEASCLTLYRPGNPRIVAPEGSFLTEGRFAFAQSIATTAEERANPWLLLNRRFADGAIPTIADQTSLMYVFHLAVGDDFAFTPEGSGPVTLRIVGTLADSVLQSELIIPEQAFTRLFPRHEGYRIWLIDAPVDRLDRISTLLEDRLSDFGVDATETRARLASYHQVENTYLSTFQALGALGLLLGTLGMAAVLARNVLERRRELGLLGAVGFTPRNVRTLVTSETLLLVVVGLVIGTISALVAIAPAVMERSHTLPFANLALLLAAVVVTGLLSSLAAVRLATGVSTVEALKSE